MVGLSLSSYCTFNAVTIVPVQLLTLISYVPHYLLLAVYLITGLEAPLQHNEARCMSVHTPYVFSVGSLDSVLSMFDLMSVKGHRITINTMSNVMRSHKAV